LSLEPAGRTASWIAGLMLEAVFFFSSLWRIVTIRRVMQSSGSGNDMCRTWRGVGIRHMAYILEQTSPVTAEAKGRRFFFLTFHGRLQTDQAEEITFEAVYEPFDGWKILQASDPEAFRQAVPDGYFQAFCLDVLKECHMDCLVRWVLEPRDGRLCIRKLSACMLRSAP